MLTTQDKLETLKRKQKRVELDKYEMELEARIKTALGEYDIVVKYEEEAGKCQSILDVINDEITKVESEV